MIWEDVTIKELFEFGSSITQQELKYYDDFEISFILEHGVYIKGISAEGELAGFGGIYKTHGIHRTSI